MNDQNETTESEQIEDDPESTTDFFKVVLGVSREEFTECIKGNGTIRIGIKTDDLADFQALEEKVFSSIDKVSSFGGDLFTIKAEIPIQSLRVASPDGENVFIDTESPNVLSFTANHLQTIEIPCVFWPEPDGGLAIVTADHKGFGLDWHAPEVQEDKAFFLAMIRERNERLGLKYPALLETRAAILEQANASGGGKAATGDRPQKYSLPELSQNIFTGASRLEQGIAYSFARLPRWTDDDGKRVFHHEGQRKNFRVTTSMPEAAWEQLKGQPATVVKAWHVLEATRHETGDPMSPFTITPDRILREIKGDRKSKFLPKEKQDATDMLNAILQMNCVMHWKDQTGKMHRTNGAVYLRTTNDETHEDLFGWVPNAMRIMVNPDLFDGKQSEFARQRAPYHKKFLAFNAQKDAGAIYIGSWILTKCRGQGKQWEAGEARIKNSTLLKILVETGVTDLKGYADRRQLCKIPDIVTRDLEKLRAVRLIESYESVAHSGTNTEDFEDGTLDEIEDILKAFPDDLPIRSDPKRKGPDGKAHRGKFAQWLNQTTRIQLGGAAEAAQMKARATAKDAKALTARRQARKGKLAGSKRETRR